MIKQRSLTNFILTLLIVMLSSSLIGCNQSPPSSASNSDSLHTSEHTSEKENDPTNDENHNDNTVDNSEQTDNVADNTNKNQNRNDDDIELTDSDRRTRSFLANIKQQYPEVVALYVGAYEPDVAEVIVNVPYIDKPVVLYLSSYHAINWNINPVAFNNQDSALVSNIVGVVYGSYEAGSHVRGVSETLLFDQGSGFGAYSSETSCHCAGGNFHCESNDLMQDISNLQSKYGIQILDYAGEYAITRAAFTNPDILVNHTPMNFAQLAAENARKRELEKNQCVARIHPDYENTYSNINNDEASLPSNEDRLVFHSKTKSYPIEIKMGLDNITPDDTQVSADYLYTFPLTTSTWGDYLNPEHNVPDIGFMAYYLNANDINTVVKSEQVFYIEKDFAYDDFLGIPSQQFNAYWVGVLTVSNSGFYDVSMNKSWSGGRVAIDRHVILEDGSRGSAKQSVYIPEGEHIVEVEYSNGWHTTDVDVQITPL